RCCCLFLLCFCAFCVIIGDVGKVHALFGHHFFRRHAQTTKAEKLFHFRSIHLDFPAFVGSPPVHAIRIGLHKILESYNIVHSQISVFH
ncbi:hypothetical protein PENTCL1PPCAC_28571, partial [Pristionchus entomophagus]